MKKNFANEAFAVIAAAVLMVSAAGCSSAPVKEEAPIVEPAQTQVEPALDQTMSNPPAESLMQDNVGSSSGSTTSAEPLSAPAAPSSLGASSSGRGH